MPVEQLMHVALAAVFGLLLGSFFNVCIYRVPRDLSVVHPRSFCPSCEKAIPWQNNIPVLSYLLLRGKCGSCGKPIGIRYPIVEAATALLFAFVVVRYGWNAVTLKWCIFESIMMVLFWVDLEERLLPDEFTLGGTAVGLIFAWFVKVPGMLGELVAGRLSVHAQSLIEALLGAILLSLPLTVVGLMWGKMMKREVLGWGDVKLLPCIGVYLGVELGIQTLLIGSLLGVLVGGSYILAMKKKMREYELPLGSFFCAAAMSAPFWAK